MSVPTRMRGLVPDPSGSHGVRLDAALPVPSPRSGEVLVRVTHATVNGHELELARHPLVRTLAFLARARGSVRTGLEFAGVVASDGAVFRQGERVMGYAEMIAGSKAHADHLVIPEAFAAHVPTSIGPAEASTLPMSGRTALVALRDVVGVQRGQRVLITGASGGVGVLAVQLAHHFGAEVTAVASSDHHDALKSLGARHTVDYRTTPVAQLEDPYDAILDFSDTLRFGDVRHLLSHEGVFVPADPIRNAFDVALRRQARYLMVDRGDTADLDALAALVDQGHLVPLVDRVFPLSHWEEAVARGHAHGRLGRTVLAFDVTRPPAPRGPVG